MDSGSRSMMRGPGRCRHGRDRQERRPSPQRPAAEGGSACSCRRPGAISVPGTDGGWTAGQTGCRRRLSRGLQPGCCRSEACRCRSSCCRAPVEPAPEPAVEPTRAASRSPSSAGDSDRSRGRAAARQRRGLRAEVSEEGRSPEVMVSCSRCQLFAGLSAAQTDQVMWLDPSRTLEAAQVGLMPPTTLRLSEEATATPVGCAGDAEATRRWHRHLQLGGPRAVDGHGWSCLGLRNRTRSNSRRPRACRGCRGLLVYDMGGAIAGEDDGSMCECR